MIGNRRFVRSSISDFESDDYFPGTIASETRKDRAWESSVSAEDINKGFETTTGKHVIILLDVDCYEVQLWVTQRAPQLLGKDVPIVVINTDYVVLSVNYSARALGIRRSFTYGEVERFRRYDPNLVVLQTGLRCDRTDSWTPQLESDTILNAIKYYKKDLRENSICVERSSRDEFYIDITNLVNARSKNLFVPGKADVERLTRATKEDPCRQHFGMPKTVLEDYNGEFRGAALRNHVLQVLPKKKERHHEDVARLIHGAVIADEIIQLIREKTGYHCSAGVAHNKLLAKMACSKNKPTGITVVTEIAVDRMWKSMNVSELPGLGGKLGEQLQDFLDQYQYPVNNLFDLQMLVYTKLDLIEYFYEKSGSNHPHADALHLKKMLSGMDSTPVFPKVHSDIMTASMTFKGRNTVRSPLDLLRSIKEFSWDIEDRLNYTITKSRRFPDEISVKVTLKRGSGANHNSVGNNRLEDVVANQPGKAKIEELIIRRLIELKSFVPENIEAVKVTAKNMYVVEDENIFPGKPNRMPLLAREEILNYLTNRIELNNSGYISGEEQILPPEPNLVNADISSLSPAEFRQNMDLVKTFDGWLSQGGPFLHSEISKRIGWQQLHLTPHVDQKTRKNIAEALHYKMMYLYFKRKNNAAKAMLKSAGILYT